MRSLFDDTKNPLFRLLCQIVNDVHFSEDACHVTDKNLQRNLNLFRKVALNYVKPYEEKYRLKSALSH